MNLSDIVGRQFESLVTFVRRRTGGVVRAKENVSDIVQSTFGEMVRAKSRIKDRGDESLRRWLREAAECKIRNRARHWAAAKRDAGREVALQCPESSDSGGSTSQPAGQGPSPASEVAFREVEQRLERAFERLPEDYRTVIRLVKVEGLPHTETAARMQRAEPATRKLLSRALARLSVEMERC